MPPNRTSPSRSSSAPGVYLSAGPAFTRQLSALTGVLAFSLLLDFVKLGIKWYRGTLWVVRRKKTTEGAWIILHHASA